MKEKILIIAICLLLINAVWGIFKPTQQPNYEYEREMYKGIQTTIDSLYKDLDRNKAAIITFKHLIYENDSIIHVADKPKLRELTRHFINRTGRYDLRNNR